MQPQSLSVAQAIQHSTEEFIWRAVLQDGSVILEQPHYSSDHLPANEVASIGYVPTRRPDLPEISCSIDLSKGERFVRYWSNVWRPNGGGIQRLYVLGIEHQGKHALLAFYPQSKKIVFSSKRPFQPGWIPKPFDSLPEDAIIRGGAGTNFVEWAHEGFGAHVEIHPKQMVMYAVYG